MIQERRNWWIDKMLVELPAADSPRSALNPMPHLLHKMARQLLEP